MGIEHVLVGVSSGANLRAGVKVRLADDPENDMGCDEVIAWLDDVEFAVIGDGGDDSARRQLIVLAEAFNAVLARIGVELTRLSRQEIESFLGSDPPRFIGSDKARQEVGDPGHCERCVEVGHVKAHPELGCGDVGCDAAHGPGDPP